ncbi:MAG TPA: LuxR C-terminal-related transcriptional regulator [Dongiaceae bacterium]|nr:LuxR C-terminal-related transcriptional regulator [Dongiaceae bacterium]
MLKRSKLLAPHVDGGIARPRLLRRLQAAQPICLLTAPAGFGKSTLAADWLQQCSGARCWLSLDATDGSGLVLWETLIECLRQARPAFGASALALLQQQPLELEGLVDNLALDLSAWRQEASADAPHLVLDDLHCLEDSPHLSALLHLLRHFSGWGRVVLTSRSLALLAQQNAVTPALIDVIDQHQLALDPEEVDALVQLRNLPVPADVRHKLWVRTEGWITPILMILCQMRNDGIIQRWNDAWLEGQVFTLAPLIRDHYDSQLPSARGLLAVLALVPQFDRTLVSTLSQLMDATGDGLDAISSDTFIIRLQQPGWWKIHDLYRTYLLERFAALSLPLQRQTVEAVADWQCRHGAHAQALALQAQYADTERLHAYLTRHYRHWLRQGLHDLLQQAAALLTDAHIQANPDLCALYLWAGSERLELAECRARVSRALVQVQQRKVQQQHKSLPVDLQVELYCALSYCEQVKGDPVSALANAQRALEISEQAVQPMRSRALLTIGLLTYMRGDMGDASPALARALVCAQEERHYYHVIISLGYWMAALQLAGQFDEALAICDRTRQWLQAYSDAHSTDLWLDLPSLNIVIARGDLDDAQRRLQPLLQFADHAAPSLRTALIYFCAVRFHYYRGDLHTSLEYLSRVEAAQLKLLLNWNWGWAPVAAWRRRFALRQNRRQELQQWFDANPVPAQGEIPFNQVEERLLDAGVLTQMGMLDQAEALASLIAEQAVRQSRLFHQFQALIVLGNVAWLRDRDLRENSMRDSKQNHDNHPEKQSNSAALEAEALAAAMGAHSILRSEALWRKGASVTPLVPTSQPDNKTHSATDAPASISQGISKRERAVLVLLAQGKSNSEIAAALHISDNTTKTHMKNILRKLEAKNRVEALILARERGVL